MADDNQWWKSALPIAASAIGGATVGGTAGGIAAGGLAYLAMNRKKKKKPGDPSSPTDPYAAKSPSMGADPANEAMRPIEDSYDEWS